MKNLLLVLYFLLITLFAKGRIVQGNLIDTKTLAPIPYANVYVNKYLGAISDIDGKFILYIKNDPLNDSIWISSIGYYRKAFLLKKLDTINANNIHMDPVVYNLNPVEIITSGISAYEMLADAFKKIKTNFQTGKRFYKGSYFEQINNYDPIKKWHTRTVNSALIIEDPGYDRLHANLLDNILENIYILGIQKNRDSLLKVPTPEGNYLKWMLERNFCRYKSEYFSDPKNYNYTLKTSYYDSTLKTNILEIKISPKNSKEEVVYGEVYLSSVDHKLFKIHILYKAEDFPIPVQTNSKDYYIHLNSDILVIYKSDNENKMILSYLKYEFGDGFFYYEQHKPHIVGKFFTEYKNIGEVENGESLVRKLPRMENSNNIYDQKMMQNKAFWLDYNIVIKE